MTRRGTHRPPEHLQATRAITISASSGHGIQLAATVLCLDSTRIFKGAPVGRLCSAWCESSIGPRWFPWRSPGVAGGDWGHMGSAHRPLSHQATAGTLPHTCSPVDTCTDPLCKIVSEKEMRLSMKMMGSGEWLPGVIEGLTCVALTCNSPSRK